MEASKQDLDTLFRLQDVDLMIMKLERGLKKIPQAEEIMQIRSKLRSIESKREKIVELKKAARKKLVKVTDEDNSLAKKETGVQAAIEAAGNDFRGVEARSKELAGIYKRREVLKEDLASCEEEMKKIEALEVQVDDAIKKSREQEAIKTQEYKLKIDEIQTRLTSLRKQHDELIASIDDSLADSYLKTIKQIGSVAIGVMDEGKCGVCRTNIESGHLIALKKEAPLGKCPNCGRLLVIEA